MSESPELKAPKLILHSYRRCPFAIRVRMTLEEKELPYEVFEENLSSLSETVLKYHPEGRVPLLIHQRGGGETDLILPESAVITQYLEEAFPARSPEKALLPANPQGRAQVRLWTQWSDHVYKPDLDLFKYEYADLAEGDRHDLLTRLHAHLRRLEKALTQNDYLLGPEITLADIHVFPLYRQLTRVKPELPELSNYLRTNAWLERLISRPSFERVMDPKRYRRV